MIKKKVLNEIVQKSAISKDFVKTKQLTLFDLKSKSITINKENEIIEVIGSEKPNAVELKKTIKDEHKKSEDSVTVKKEAPRIVTTIGGVLAFDEYPKIDNNYFGDLIMVIELYNTYLKLYEQIMDHKSLQEDVKVSKIDYEKLMECLNDESSNSYFHSIIETILRMIVNDKSFSANFTEKIKINNFTIQEVCRVVLQTDRKMSSSTEENESGNSKSIFDLFLYPKDQIGIISNLFTIDLNRFKFEQKLELIKLLSSKLLNLEVFLNCFNELTSKISEKKNGIKDCKSKMAEIKSDLATEKKLQNLVQKMDKLVGEKDEMVKFLNKCARIEPIGCDNEQNLYWRFECLSNCIIREIRVGEEAANNSNWFKHCLDNHDLNDLIKFLGINYKANLKLISDLKQFRKVVSPSNQQIDGFLIKPEKPAEEIVNIETFNIRRSTRIAAKTTVKINNEEESSEEEDIIENNENESIFDKYSNLEPLDCLYNILNDLNKRVVNSCCEPKTEYFQKWDIEHENGIKCSNLNEKFQILKNLFKQIVENLPQKILHQNFISTNFHSSIQESIEKTSTISNFYILLKILDLNIKSWKVNSKKLTIKNDQEELPKTRSTKTSRKANGEILTYSSSEKESRSSSSSSTEEVEIDEDYSTKSQPRRSKRIDEVELPKTRPTRLSRKQVEKIIIDSSSESAESTESENEEDYSRRKSQISTRQSKRAKPMETILNLRTRSAKKPLKYNEISSTDEE